MAARSFTDQHLASYALNIFNLPQSCGGGHGHVHISCEILILCKFLCLLCVWTKQHVLSHSGRPAVWRTGNYTQKQIQSEFLQTPHSASPNTSVNSTPRGEGLAGERWHPAPIVQRTQLSQGHMLTFLIPTEGSEGIRARKGPEDSCCTSIKGKWPLSGVQAPWDIVELANTLGWLEEITPFLLSSQMGLKAGVDQRKQVTWAQPWWLLLVSPPSCVSLSTF